MLLVIDKILDCKIPIPGIGPRLRRRTHQTNAPLGQLVVLMTAGVCPVGTDRIRRPRQATKDGVNNRQRFIMLGTIRRRHRHAHHHPRLAVGHRMLLVPRPKAAVGKMTEASILVGTVILIDPIGIQIGPDRRRIHMQNPTLNQTARLALADAPLK